MALIKYNGKNIYSCMNLILMPGINEVDETKLKTVEENPLFQQRINSGIITIIEREKGEYKPVDAGTLVRLMPEVYDVNKLREYIETSHHKTVVQAAKKQLEKIDNYDKDDEVEVAESF